MPGPLLPIILTAGTALVGSFFKNIDSKLSNNRKHRDEELAKATQTYKEISVTLDTLYYYQHDVAIWVALRMGKKEPNDPVDNINAADIKDWDAYNVALTFWMENRTRLITEYTAYFGTEHQDVLLRIAKSFKEGKKILGSTYYRQNSSSDLLKNYREDPEAKINYGKFFGIYESAKKDEDGNTVYKIEEPVKDKDGKTVIKEKRPVQIEYIKNDIYNLVLDMNLKLSAEEVSNLKKF